MTGMERNSDVVVMASYAPLFVNLNHRAWNPDLINFDSSQWYGLPSYYVQKMFAENRGDVTLPIDVDSPEAEIAAGRGMIGVGTWNTAAEFKDIKVTAPDGKVLFTSDFSSNGRRLENARRRRDWKVAGRRAAAERGKGIHPRAGRRQVMDGLHAHAQGAENCRRGRLSDFVPHRRR